MENYTKGDNHEVDDDAPEYTHTDGIIQMKVAGASKIHNLMAYASAKMKDEQTRQIVWNAMGNAVSKAVSCAEIMKRKTKGLHQITSLRYIRLVETWVPKMAGLDSLQVNKDVPAIAILLSKDALDTTLPGYQSPTDENAFWKETSTKSTARFPRNPPSKHTGTNRVNRPTKNYQKTREETPDSGMVDGQTTKGNNFKQGGKKDKQAGSKGNNSHQDGKKDKQAGSKGNNSEHDGEKDKRAANKGNNSSEYVKDKQAGSKGNNSEQDGKKGSSKNPICPSPSDNVTNVHVFDDKGRDFSDSANKDIAGSTNRGNSSINNDSRTRIKTVEITKSVSGLRFDDSTQLGDRENTPKPGLSRKQPQNNQGGKNTKKLKQDHTTME